VGWIPAADNDGRKILLLTRIRDRRRFVVRPDEKLTAFVQVESAISAHAKGAWRAKKSWLRIASKPARWI